MLDQTQGNGGNGEHRRTRAPIAMVDADRQKKSRIERSLVTKNHRLSAMMEQAVNSQFLIALGSNLGDRVAMIEAAAAAIAAQVGSILARAPLYETPPALAATQDFVNSALICQTGQNPEQLMTTLLAIEAGLGRVRAERWGDRVIDLDLLLWRRAADAFTSPHNGPLAILPHPRMLERDFVLVPAAAVAPDWQWRQDDQTTLAALCRDRGFALRPMPSPQC